MLASIGFGDTPSQTYAMKILDLEREQARQKRAAEEEAAILAAEPQKRPTKKQKAAAGVSIGTTLRRALALCPEAVFLPNRQGDIAAAATQTYIGKYVPVPIHGRVFAILGALNRR